MGFLYGKDKVEMVIWGTLHAAGVLIGLLFVFVLTRKYRLPRWRALGCVAAAEAASVLTFLALQMYFPEPFDGRNCLFTIVIFPLFLCVFSLAFRLPFPEMPELSSPVMLIMLFFNRIACQCTGRCASSVSVKWGIFDEVAQKNLLPLQLFEAAAVLLILTVLFLLWRKGEKFRAYLVPVSLFATGLLAFVTSFLRAGSVAFGMFSEQALWALFLMVEGIFWDAARRVFSRLRDLVNN